MNDWERISEDRYKDKMDWLTWCEIKVLIRTLLEKQQIITEITANDVHKVTKDQCADELEALNLESIRYYDQEQLNNLTKEWRK